MQWVLVFGGIAVGGVVLYAALGVWLWRRATALFLELDRTASRAEAVLASEPATGAGLGE